MPQTHNKASLTAVEYCLPDRVLTNEDIAAAHPEWSVEKIYEKTGICRRHIAAEGETAADLAFRAAEALLDRTGCPREEIDLLVLCTQTPDYALPTTACVLQHRLGLPTTCAAFDYNLGCSGFVYGLAIVKSMLEGGQASKALLLTADTYSKWLSPDDKGVLTIFGDGAAATLVELVDAPDSEPPLGPFVYGTDGGGFDRLIVPGSGARPIREEDCARMGEGRPKDRLFMDGPEIFTFTIRTVPRTVKALLARAACTLKDLDLIVYHQANAYILEYLRNRSKIPVEKFVVELEGKGNTVSSTIPIALRDIEMQGRLKPGMRLALVAFGVGYSWAAGLIRWHGRAN